MPSLKELIKNAWDSVEEKQRKNELIKLEVKIEKDLHKKTNEKITKNKI